MKQSRWLHLAPHSHHPFFRCALRLGAFRREAFGGGASDFRRSSRIPISLLPGLWRCPGQDCHSLEGPGGDDGFADHVQHAGKAFPELTLHPDLWRCVRPATSLSPHLFLKAVEGAEKDSHCAPGTFESAIRITRAAFLERGRNIGHANVHREIAEELSLDIAVLQRYLDEGDAYAALSADYKEAENLDVRCSPTMILNEGRQKLYGNIGYRIIEANIQELLREPNPDQASWC